MKITQFATHPNYRPKSIDQLIVMGDDSPKVKLPGALVELRSQLMSIPDIKNPNHNWFLRALTVPENPVWLKLYSAIREGNLESPLTWTYHGSARKTSNRDELRRLCSEFSMHHAVWYTEYDGKPVFFTFNKFVAEHLINLAQGGQHES